MAQVLPQVLSQALTRYGRDHVASLKLLEPVVLEKLPRMSSSMIADVFVAYSKQKCGSRTFWESVLAAATSENVSSDLPTLVRLIDCVNTCPTFYRPKYLLSELYPRISIIESLSVSDLSKLLRAYSQYPKILDYRTFANQIVCETTKREVNDLESLASILSCVSNMYSVEIEEFFRLIESTSLANADILQSEASSWRYHFLSGLYRGSVRSNRPLNREVVLVLFKAISPQFCSPSQLSVLTVLSAKLFGLINTFKYNPLNMGHTIEGREHIQKFSTQLTKAIMADQVSVRDLARVAEWMAQVREGSVSFWSSLCGSLEKSDLSSLSPEELSGLSFAVFEMNLDSIGHLVLISVFEKVNLFTSSLLNPILPLAHKLGALDRIAELVDISNSDCPSIIFANMVFLEFDSNYFDYQKSCQSIIDSIIFNDIEMNLKKVFGGTVEKNFKSVLIDFIIRDSDENPRVACLVSSPLHVFEKSTATGTARLRHEIVRSLLPPECRLINISAEEWIGFTEAEKDLTLTTDEEPLADDVVEETVVASYPAPTKNGFDISNFVRRDRNAAHKKRAPPSTELPWVSTVLTLKSKPRSRGRN